MINKPSVEELSDKADSVFTLVILASRRARQINKSKESFLEDVDEENEKAVSLSLEEIQQSKINYKKNTDNTYK